MDLTDARPLYVVQQGRVQPTATYQATEGWGETPVEALTVALSAVCNASYDSTPAHDRVSEWSASVPVILDMAK
jgi:hypothetical protein